jgi:hypothetical protein
MARQRIYFELVQMQRAEMEQHNEETEEEERLQSL